MAGDVTWIDVLPSMDTFAKQLATGTTKAAADAGKASGLAWAKGFEPAAKNGAAKAAVDELEVAAKSTKIDAINRRMMNEAMLWPPANR